MNHKKAVFVLQAAEDSLKAIKFTLASGEKKAIADLFAEVISPDADAKKIAERLTPAFKKFGYRRDPLWVSLPRNQGICRYLKIPAQAQDEIEKIISLQAPRYLPYPPNLLITAYQVISLDREGNSYLNLVIVHKNVIERYLNIAKAMEAKEISVVLSSWGVCNFYDYFRPQEQAAAMVVDIDLSQAELAIISKGKVLFSRYFKISTTAAGWEERFGDEIKKTHEAYLKEGPGEIPVKIGVSGASGIMEKFADILRKNSTLPVEVLSFADQVQLAAGTDPLAIGRYSFTDLLGLGMKQAQETVVLVPAGIKEQGKKISFRQEQVKLAFFVLGIVCIFGTGLLKNLYNKAVYLKQLKTELNKVAAQAGPLEKMERKVNLLENRMGKGPSALEVVYELHKIMPENVYLVSLGLEEGRQVVIRGQAPELNAVVFLNAALQKSAVFKDFSAAIRFTTNRKTQAGEIVDFEIACVKEK